MHPEAASAPPCRSPGAARAQAARGGVLWALLGLVACATALSAAQAAPFTPSADDELVERLPWSWDAATRGRQAALARDPGDLGMALSAARAAIDRARRHGDPRELGVAQAALDPWWALPDPPPAVRLLRATVRQGQHDFDAALRDLNALWSDADTVRVPTALRAQAGLTRVTVLQVSGQLDAAADACAALGTLDGGAALQRIVRACGAALRSLRGERDAAAAELDRLAHTAADDRWIALLRAELAQRRGDRATADAAFRVAARPTGGEGTDVYARAAYADWLLDEGRPADAARIAGERGGEPLRANGGAPGRAVGRADRPAESAAGDDADALLLRRAIAAQRLGDARAPALAAALQARLDAARERGDPPHLREEARLALDVQGDAARALALAERQWRLQKEPADALLLHRAARAAGRPQAARTVADWAARWGTTPVAIDVRLADDATTIRSAR